MVSIEIERKMEQDKQKWEDKFTRATNERIRRTEENVITDFRSGVNDAQKHCDAIFNSVQKSVKNLETRLEQRIEAMMIANSTRLSETQIHMKKLIDDGLSERDTTIKSSFQEQNDRLRLEMANIRTQTKEVRSRCCTIS